MVGVAAAQGRCVPGQQRSHKEQADPGTKCAVRKDCSPACPRLPTPCPRVHGGVGGAPHSLRRVYCKLLPEIRQLRPNSGALYLSNRKLHFSKAALDSSLATQSTESKNYNN